MITLKDTKEKKILHDLSLVQLSKTRNTLILERASVKASVVLWSFDPPFTFRGFGYGLYRLYVGFVSFKNLKFFFYFISIKQTWHNYCLWIDDHE